MKQGQKRVDLVLVEIDCSVSVRIAAPHAMDATQRNADGEERQRKFNTIEDRQVDGLVTVQELVSVNGTIVCALCACVCLCGCECLSVSVAV